LTSDTHTRNFCELSVIANIPHEKEVYKFISLPSLDRQILFEFRIKVILGGTGEKKRFHPFDADTQIKFSAGSVCMSSDGWSFLSVQAVILQEHTAPGAINQYE
jgi:hypothetical protein